MKQKQRNIIFEIAVALSVSIGFCAPAVFAYDTTERVEKQAEEKPKELQGVGVTERLGENIDLNLKFTNETGALVPLSTYFTNHKPVLLTIVYYSCPNLCNYQLNGLVDVMGKIKGVAGKDFEVVAVSMDEKETPELAAKKKVNYMKALNQPQAEAGWHLLVGGKEQIKQLAEQVGFAFRWDAAQKQFAHSAAVYILTPQGRISRYLHGIDFSPQTLRLSFVEASDGKIGDLVEHFALFCFQFDPSKSKYTLAAFKIMQIAAAGTLVLLAIFLVPVWMRERQRKAQGLS